MWLFVALVVGAFVVLLGLVVVFAVQIWTNGNDSSKKPQTKEPKTLEKPLTNDLFKKGAIFV